MNNQMRRYLKGLLVFSMLFVVTGCSDDEPEKPKVKKRSGDYKISELTTVPGDTIPATEVAIPAEFQGFTDMKMERIADQYYLGLNYSASAPYCKVVSYDKTTGAFKEIVQKDGVLNTLESDGNNLFFLYTIAGTNEEFARISSDTGDVIDIPLEGDSVDDTHATAKNGTVMTMSRIPGGVKEVKTYDSNTLALISQYSEQDEEYLEVERVLLNYHLNYNDTKKISKATKAYPYYEVLNIETGDPDDTELINAPSLVRNEDNLEGQAQILNEDQAMLEEIQFTTEEGMQNEGYITDLEEKLVFPNPVSVDQLITNETYFIGQNTANKDTEVHYLALYEYEEKELIEHPVEEMKVDGVKPGNVFFDGSFACYSPTSLILITELPVTTGVKE